MDGLVKAVVYLVLTNMIFGVFSEDYFINFAQIQMMVFGKHLLVGPHPSK